MMPKVSIIVPVYKVEEFLSKCIESILKQNFKDFELLLIDDGSPDNSGRICDHFASLDPRIVVRHEENSGVSITRNKGLDIAKGEWVVFIDSDDWIEPTFLENYIVEISEFPVKLIYQGLISEYSETSVPLLLSRGRYIGKAVADALYEVEYKMCLGGACNKIFYRDIIERNNIRFDPSLSFGEDKIFTLQYCIHIENISLLDTVEYHYNRTRDSSLSHLHHATEMLTKLAEWEYELFSKLNEKFNNNKFIEAARGRYVSMHKYILISMYRPNVLKKKNDRLVQMEHIHRFLQQYSIDADFDRDIPKIAHMLINRKSDPGLRLIMWLRYKFSAWYSFVRKYKN